MKTTSGARAHRSVQPKRRRFTALALGTGLAGSLAIALSMGASLSSLTATINNSVNTAASATMAITETGTTGATGTCNSYDSTTTCSTINKYGGTGTPLVPGASQTQVVTFTNTGNVPVGSSSLTPSACVAATVVPAVPGATAPTTPNTSAGNLCSVLNIAVYKGATATGTALYNGPASGFTAPVTTLGSIAAGSSQAYTFVVALPQAATNAVQGQTVSQPLGWTFNQ